MPKNISFRIRRKYFDQIVSGEKTFELRQVSKYWQNKFLKVTDGGRWGWEDYIGGQAVFVCGKDVHRREIVGIQLGLPEDFLDRELSYQGKLDIPTKMCFCIKLGEVVEKGGNP